MHRAIPDPAEIEFRAFFLHSHEASPSIDRPSSAGSPKEEEKPLRPSIVGYIAEQISIQGVP